MSNQLTISSGLTIGYREWGRPDGPVAILLHGLGSSGASWGNFAPGLGQRFRVIAPDGRGHGDSTWTDHYSLEAMRDDVIAVMDGLGVLAAVLIGHSMGGATAYLLAATRPERVRALVLEDPPPPVPADPPRELPIGAEPGDVVDWHARAELLQWRNAPEPGWWDYAEQIRCPALVVGAALGHMPQDRLRELARRMPRGSYVALQVGHDIHTDRPGELLAVVQPFLSRSIR